MKIFDKLFSKIFIKNDIEGELDTIKDDIIDDIVTYTMSKVDQDANLIMTENTKEGFKAYPLINEDLHRLVVYKYRNKYNEKIKTEDQIKVIDWTDKLIYTDELALKLGAKYNEEYTQWEEDYYKDADDIEEEMWRFENEGKVKYKGYIEQALEKADDFKGNINYDITPNLLEQEQEIRPYIEHDENPNEIVNSSIEAGDMELLEIEQLDI